MLFMMKSLGWTLATIRAVLIVFLVASHGGMIALLPETSSKLRAYVIQSFGRTITWALGVRVTTFGAPSIERAIIIANHRSYSDIPVLAGLCPVVFLAKAELAGWPVIGWAARKARTVFVDRHDPKSREHSRKTLRDRLSEGLSVLVFSEGTTSARGTLLPLKPGMFHEAALAQLPIQVVYLEYSEDDDSWINDDTIADHFYARFSRWNTHIKVVYRKELMHASIDEVRPGQRMCEEATAWLHAQIKRDFGDIRS